MCQQENPLSPDLPILSAALQDANGNAVGHAKQMASEADVLKTKSASLKKRQEKAAAEQAERHRKAQLELLLMDEKALQDAVKLGTLMIPYTKESATVSASSQESL